MPEHHAPLIAALCFILLVPACTTVDKNRTEEYLERREGRLPFVLNFPAGSARDSAGLSAIERKAKPSAAERWALCRHYHTQTADAPSLARIQALYRELAIEREYYFMANSNLACAQASAARYKDSEALMQRLMEERSPVIATYYNLYILYKYSRRSEDGIKVLALMRERFPGDVYARVELADIFLERKNQAYAEQLYREAMDACPGSPIPVFRLAQLAAQNRKFEEAEQLYRRCISSFPDFRDAWVEYSRLLLDMNKNKEASELIQRMLKRFGGK